MTKKERERIDAAVDRFEDVDLPQDARDELATRREPTERARMAVMQFAGQTDYETLRKLAGIERSAWKRSIYENELSRRKARAVELHDSGRW